jgi:hypothetical protein
VGRWERKKEKKKGGKERAGPFRLVVGLEGVDPRGSTRVRQGLHESTKAAARVRESSRRACKGPRGSARVREGPRGSARVREFPRGSERLWRKWWEVYPWAYGGRTTISVVKKKWHTFGSKKVINK